MFAEILSMLLRACLFELQLLSFSEKLLLAFGSENPTLAFRRCV
jgi:hypothetical protein